MNDYRYFIIYYSAIDYEENYFEGAFGMVSKNGSFLNHKYCTEYIRGKYEFKQCSIVNIKELNKKDYYEYTDGLE